MTRVIKHNRTLDSIKVNTLLIFPPNVFVPMKPINPVIIVIKHKANKAFNENELRNNTRQIKESKNENKLIDLYKRSPPSPFIRKAHSIYYSKILLFILIILRNSKTVSLVR